MTAPLDQHPFFTPSSGLTINSAKRFLVKRFREADLDTPELDARILVIHTTTLSHADIIARGTESLPSEIFQQLIEYSKRRIAGEPIDHILGYREFYGRRFIITKDVLSPRPETEMLVSAALKIFEEKPTGTFLDLGTGSGAIATSILSEAPGVEGTAVDISKAALNIMLKNATHHNVTDRLEHHEGSWFEPVVGRFDIIISNPPYITSKAMTALETEVKAYDPDMSLHGGENGLNAYRIIIPQAANYLNTGGYILFEIGYDQGKTVSHLLEEARFTDISISQDLSGHDRMIKAAYKE